MRRAWWPNVSMALSWPTLWRKVGTINWLLSPLALLYSAGWEAYLLVYRLGLKRPFRAKVPVLCVGNLRVGGTGKTPFVRALCEWLLSRGHSVVVSASGYGSPRSVGATIAPSGPLDSSAWGDEPALLRQWLPGLPLIVGRNRVEAARLADLHFAQSLLVLDDGFQHLPLAKSASIVLRPDPDKNRMCIPAGPYREPAWHYRRANLVVPDHGPAARTITITDVAGREVGLTGQTVDVLCAIAQPDSVAESLAKLGLKPRNQIALSDHDPLTTEDLFEQFEGDIPIVVTGKDWVKLRHHPARNRVQIWIIDYRVNFSERLTCALEKLVDQMVKARTR